MIAITLRNTRESRYLGEQMRPIIPGAFPSCVIFDDKEMLRLQGTSEINRDKVADGRREGIKKKNERTILPLLLQWRTVRCAARYSAYKRFIMLFPTLFKLHLDTRCFILYRAFCLSPQSGNGSRSQMTR